MLILLVGCSAWHWAPVPINTAYHCGYLSRSDLGARTLVLQGLGFLI